MTELVENAGVVAFLRCPVVAGSDDERVIGEIQFIERVEEPAELSVGVIKKRSERLLEPAGEGTLGVVEVVPRPHPGIARCEIGSLRNDAHLQLALVGPLPPDIPALIKAAAILREIVVRRLMGSGGSHQTASRGRTDARAPGSDGSGSGRSPGRPDLR